MCVCEEYNYNISHMHANSATPPSNDDQAALKDILSQLRSTTITVRCESSCHGMMCSQCKAYIQVHGKILYELFQGFWHIAMPTPSPHTRARAVEGGGVPASWLCVCGSAGQVHWLGEVGY